MINGRAFKPSEWNTVGLPIIRIQNLNNPVAPYNYCDFDVDQKFHLKDGDFLISWSGTPGTSFGAFIWDRGPAVLNQHIFRCELYGDSFFRPYLRLAIKAQLNEMISQAHGGVGLQHITKGKLEKLLITLPPFAEQNRIVAKVDQLMQLCDQLDVCHKKASTKYESLNDAALEKLLSSKTIDEFAGHWQFICNNFDFIYNDPAHVNKLRQGILQLAVQGKLAPQDPIDEPASVLLEKIKAEKEKLIKAKTFQKAKTVPSIEAKNIPYKAPLNWEWKKVIDLCFVTKLAGFEYTKYVSLADSGEIPVIRAQNVKKNNINESNLKYIDMKTSKLLDRCALDRPAILMTFIGAGIGDTAIFDKKERWHLAPNVAKLVPFNYYSEKLDIRYIQYYLMSNVGGSEIFKHKKSTAQPSLSMNTIRNILIIIPPLKEQCRIVAKVDQLMHFCHELETRLNQSKKNSEMLMQAVLHEAFS